MESAVHSHECWWSRHRATELALRGSELGSAGVSYGTVQRVAEFLGTTVMPRPDPEEDDGDAESFEEVIAKGTCELVFGGVAEGSIHDDCFVALRPASREMMAALVDAVLEIHAGYLARAVDWSRVREAIVASIAEGATLRIRSDRRTGVLRVRLRRGRERGWARWFGRRLRIECATGTAILD